MVRKRQPVTLQKVFKGLQKQMEAKLTFSREVIQHPTAKGSAAELEWLELLSTYLPRRYCADSAFVIDSKGRVSDQIDIVIYDRQYSPFILHQNGVTFIPAECTYAVIEVKQTLTRRTIAYSQEKAASVRRLVRTSAPIPHAGGMYAPKPPARILAGIVALSGTLSKSEQKRLVEAPEIEILNFGCSLLGRTCFTLPKIHPWDENKRPYQMHIFRGDTTLVKFFLGLVAELQKVGTVPAIDISAYE